MKCFQVRQLGREHANKNRTDKINENMQISSIKSIVSTSKNAMLCSRIQSAKYSPFLTSYAEYHVRWCERDSITDFPQYCW